MYLQSQNPALVQNHGGSQQGFVGQNLQSGAMMGSNFQPFSNAWNYRFQPTSTAMNQTTGQTGQYIQPTGQLNQFNTAPVSSNAFMQQTSTSIVQPSIDISETQNELVVACNIQNANVNDLNLTATEDSLSISAQAFSGNQASSLHRTIPLPTTIRAEAIDANYSNGMLQIRMPKKNTSERRQLQVNINE